MGQEAARQIDELATELAGDGQPGEDYLARAGRLTAARSQAEEIILPQQILLPPEPGRQRGPGGERPAAGEHAAAPGDRPQPPDVGGGQRRAGGTAPGQLAAPRFRPRGQDDLAPSGAVARIRANLAALATLRAIQREDRPATPDEQAVLARWSGWGAVPEVFDDRRAGVRLGPRGTVPPADPGGAVGRRPQHPERALHRRRARPGHLDGRSSSSASTGGRVLEPGCGSGNFIGFAPGGAQVTGRRAGPGHRRDRGARSTRTPTSPASPSPTPAPAEGSFDLAIGNVPFGNFALHDRRHNPGGHSIHNHFIIKALHLVRPGGLVAVVTSRYTMDARNPAARREIAALADLVGAVRLPSGAHQRAAGTKVVTDLLIFRRREPGRDPDAHRLGADPDRRAGRRPGPGQRVLPRPPRTPCSAQLRAVHGAYSAEDLVVAASGDTTAALARALARDRRGRRGPRPHLDLPQPDARRRAAEPGPRSRHPDGYLEAHRDGTFTQVADGHAVPFPVPASQAAELRHLLAPARQRSPACWTPRRPRRTTPPSSTRLRARPQPPLRRTTCGPTGRSTGSPGGAPAAPTRTPASEKLARIRPPQGGFRSDPFAPAGPGAGGVRPGQPDRRQGRDLHRPRRRPPQPPPGRRQPRPTRWRSAWTSAAKSRLDEIARLLGTTEDAGPPRARHAGLRRPRNRAAGPGRGVPVRQGPRQARGRRAGRRGRPPLRRSTSTELRKVIPPDLTPGEIDARLGASWIDASYVRDFLREILDDPRRAGRASRRADLDRPRQPAHRAGHLHLGHQPLPGPAARPGDPGTAPHRGPRQASADDDLGPEHRRRPSPRRKKPPSWPSGSREWAWEDPARAGAAGPHLQRAVQQTSCCAPTTTRQLSLPGLALSFEPRPHQVAAVARIINEPAVGCCPTRSAPGKTAEMTMGAMELRRLGLVRKPAHRGPQPHARAVQPRVPPALPPGQGPGHPARRPPGRPAPPVRRPLRHRRLGRASSCPGRRSSGSRMSADAQQRLPGARSWTGCGTSSRHPRKATG